MSRMGFMLSRALDGSVQPGLCFHWRLAPSRRIERRQLRNAVGLEPSLRPSLGFEESRYLIQGVWNDFTVNEWGILFFFLMMLPTSNVLLKIGSITADRFMLTTERPNLSLTLTEMDADSWVIFELPGFTTAASGTEQSSLDALRKASDTSYFKAKDALWVKVVSNGNGARGPIGGGPGGGTSIQVSR